MKRIHEGLAYKDFPKPAGITTATVCKDSGCLPLDTLCAQSLKGNSTYTEYFALGTTPTNTCNHHIKLDVCSQTGQLATAECPTTVSKVFIYGADANTQDAAYIASLEFLGTTCLQHGGSTTIIPTPENSQDSSGNVSLSDAQLSELLALAGLVSSEE